MELQKKKTITKTEKKCLTFSLQNMPYFQMKQI